MVFQTANQEIAVVGVFVDLDDGTAPVTETPVTETPVTETATTTPTTAPIAEKLRFRMRGARTKRQEPEPAPPVEGSFGGQQGFLTTPMVAAPGVSSGVLETVFSGVGEIATPGTSTKTAALAMSEIVSTLLAGSFRR